MHVKNGSKDLKRYPQISRRVRDTPASIGSVGGADSWHRVRCQLLTPSEKAGSTQRRLIPFRAPIASHPARGQRLSCSSSSDRVFKEQVATRQDIRAAQERQEQHTAQPWTTTRRSSKSPQTHPRRADRQPPPPPSAGPRPPAASCASPRASGG